MLLQQGAIDPDRLAEALEQQRQQDQRLGRILIANRLISGEDLGAALSAQSGLGRIDLRMTPADPDLVASIEPYRCLELEAVPWRQIGGTRVIAISSPDVAAAAERTTSTGPVSVRACAARRPPGTRSSPPG